MASFTKREGTTGREVEREISFERKNLKERERGLESESEL